MRLELALVFGILLFCCWCAYIIARMNASVGAPAPNSGADYVVRPNSSATYSTYSNYNPDPNQTILAALPSAAYSAQGQTHAGPDSAMAWQPHHATNMHPGSMGAHHHQQHHHQVHAPFARRPEASAPVARLVQVPGVGEQLEAPGGHVARAPYLSGIHQWPVAAGGAPAHWPGHAYPAPVGAPNLAAAAGPGRQPQSGAPDEAEQADDEGADNGLDQEAAPANDEPAGDESGDEQPRAELDEVVGRRSFSEDELDANERDRAGNVIVAHKRHLINGRPVGAGSLKANRTNWAPDSEATRPAANQADDFDKLVSEIDGERRRHKSRRSGGAPTRRRGPDGEQQESDDAEEQSNDPATGAERRQDSADMLSSDKPGASDDSLNSAGGAELDANEQEGAEDTQAAGTAPPTTGRPADSHEHRLHETLSAQQWDDDSTLGAGKARPGASDEPPDVVGQDEEARGLEELARDLLLGAHERRKRHADSSGRPGEPGARVVPAAGARNKRARAARASQGPAGSERDTLVGQEDISIEVLASGVPGAPGQPDAANQSQPLAGAYYQLPSAAPPVSLQPVVAPSGHLAGPMNQFPQIASPFASDTHTDETKRRKQKSNKSKMTSSKYKAAKAFADKHERRQKKGKMYKKKRGSQQKLVAAKKHFKGSTSGKKASRGVGSRGADKGATYFKDKGFKKRGFKKVYHKLETGDHKTYFDEFRDKDHNKKWKKFNDKHKYSKSKKWSGGDQRHHKQHKLKASKGKVSKDGHWRERASSKHVKKAHKLKEAEGSKVKKWRKRKRKKAQHKAA